jgi:protein-S-isoprenylcysteine O-methyltransferase Ste14
MPWLAAVLLTTFLVVVFPLRSLIRTRRHGAAGRPDWREPRPRSWQLADLLFLSGFAMLLAGTIIEGLGVVDPLVDSGTAGAVSSVVLFCAAGALALWAQATMGPAWRPDIPPIGDGQLVTSGPFRFVRNPNYVAMLAAGLGAGLLAPNPVAIAGWVVLLASLLLTARVEEPPLRARFGDAYRAYGARVGRFIPGVGRLRD